MKTGGAIVAHTMHPSDAGPNAVFFATRQFCNDVGIGNMGARHSDHIQQPFLDGITRCRNVVDLGCVKHGDIDFALKGRGTGKPRCLAFLHPRHTIGDQRQFCVKAAVIGIDKIHQTIGFKLF